MPFCSLKIGISVVGVCFFFFFFASSSSSVISWLIPSQAIMLKDIIFVILQGLFFTFKVLMASVTQQSPSSLSRL